MTCLNKGNTVFTISTVTATKTNSLPASLPTHLLMLRAGALQVGDQERQAVSFSR